MCPKSNVGLKLVLQIIFCVIISSVRGRWNDTYDKYDLAYLRRDYLAKYCPTGEEHADLENFLNCSSSKPGLSFPNLPENITSEEFSHTFHGQIQSYCESSWSSVQYCEKEREKFVDRCFLTFPSISVGWDLISALFEAACRQKNNNNDNNATSSSSPIAYLVILRRNLRHWWYNERDVVSCFNEISLEYYKRDINMVLNCLKYQLRYRNCATNGEIKCDNLFEKLAEAVKSSYSSSGYVYLTSYNLTLINSERFPVVGDLAALGVNGNNTNCTGGFAYIAFFSLLVLVVITLGLFLSVKVKCVNPTQWRYEGGVVRHQELVGRNSIEM